MYGPSSQYELTTGQHVPGTTSDITINIDPGYFQYIDMDYGLTYASQVPGNVINPIDVFLHELMHGFGMTGWYNQSGQLPGAYESTFDNLIRKSATGAYFVGANAEAAYGGPSATDHEQHHPRTTTISATSNPTSTPRRRRSRTRSHWT